MATLEELLAEQKARQQQKEFEIKRLGITNIENIQYGQIRAYADSEYIWDIETDGKATYDEILAFSKQYLRENNQTHSDWQPSIGDWGLANIYFHGYHKLTDKGNGKFRYYVFEPYTD